MEMDVEEVEHKEVLKCESEVVCMQNLVGCGCSELEERIKKAEGRCVELEVDIQRKKMEYEVLKTKLKALEVDKLAIEDGLKVLKRENAELKKRVSNVEGERKVSSGRERYMDRIVDLTEENGQEDRIVQLLIENKVLQCEKKRAESEVGVWKEMFRDLELRVLVLNENSTKTGWGLRNVISHEVSEKKEAIEGIRTRDGLRDGTSFGYVQNKAKIETLVDVGSTICHSPGKGIGDLQAAGTKLQDILIICFFFKKKKKIPSFRRLCLD
jgi:hypothetical protein